LQFFDGIEPGIAKGVPNSIQHEIGWLPCIFHPGGTILDIGHSDDDGRESSGGGCHDFFK
jgi:hypothetical protein